MIEQDQGSKTSSSWQKIWGVCGQERDNVCLCVCVRERDVCVWVSSWREVKILSKWMERIFDDSRRWNFLLSYPPSLSFHHTDTSLYLPLSLSLSLSLTHPHTLKTSLPLSFTHPVFPFLSLSFYHTNTLNYVFLYFCLSYTHKNSFLSRLPPLPFSLSLTHTLFLSPFYPLSHTHTHTLSLSLLSYLTHTHSFSLPFILSHTHTLFLSPFYLLSLLLSISHTY